MKSNDGWPVEKALRTRQEREEFAIRWRDPSRRRKLGLHPQRYVENEDLRRAVIGQPDLDEPRWEYARWMKNQTDSTSVEIGKHVDAELRISEAYRQDPRADVSALRRLPPWETSYDLDLLMFDGLIGQLRTQRGFVEHVAVRAHRLLEIADELFGLAPIRQLTLIGVPAVVDELARWPHLTRMRALWLPVLSGEDVLTDDVLAKLLASPYLHNVAHLELDDQTRLTSQAHEQIVMAPTLPQLSCFTIKPRVLTCWAEPVSLERQPGELSYFDRVMESPPESGDLRDTPKPVILRPEDWIVDLERRVGYVPCIHPEEHYGRYRPDPAAVVEHPVARDSALAGRRGEPVPDPGPKPSLMERRRQGLCAICGSSEFDYEPGREDVYSDPMGLAGIYACRRCGTRWFRDQWPERQALEASHK